MLVTRTEKITTSELSKDELESISESLLIKCKSDPELLMTSIIQCFKNNPKLIFHETNLKNNRNEEFTLTHKRMITLGFGLAATAILVTFEIPYNIFAAIPFVMMGIFSGFKSIKK